MWLAGFLSVVAWHYVYGMKEAVYNFLHTVHVVPSTSAQKPCLPHQRDIIPYVVKISVLRSCRWAKVYPKHVELILEINKTVIVASSWCSILLYFHLSIINQSNARWSNTGTIPSPFFIQLHISNTSVLPCTAPFPPSSPLYLYIAHSCSPR
jgi:hypothetical protein